MKKEPTLVVRLTLFPLLGLFFLVAATVIVLLALGYQLNFLNGKIIAQKTGSIILATRPGDAKVYVDGEVYKKRTSPFSFFTVNIDRLKVGNHEIKLEKDGYETWKGVFSVEPGMVSWGSKILFVPKSREATAFHFNGNVESSLSSIDKTKELVIVDNTSAKTRDFWEVETNSKNKRKLLSIEKADESYQPITYSSNSERILLLKTQGEAKSFIVLESRENARVWNLTSLFNIAIDRAVFNPRNSDELYFLRGKTLYNLNYQEKRQSAVLDDNVIDLYNSRESLFIIKNTSGNIGLWRIESNNNKNNIIKNLPVSESYQFAYLPELGTYAVVPNKEKSLLIFSASSGSPTLKEIADNVDWILPSPKSKYLAYYQGGNVVCYELEKARYFTTLTNKKIQSLSWFDDEFNLIYGMDNKVNLVTYFGYYDQFLFETSGFGSEISPNTNNIYFVSGAKDLAKKDLFVFSFNY